eukprot:COSAG01_NODE_6452_length_3660_cov_2.580174_1_plen_146_part_00
MLGVDDNWACVKLSDRNRAGGQRHGGATSRGDGHAPEGRGADAQMPITHVHSVLTRSLTLSLGLSADVLIMNNAFLLSLSRPRVVNDWSHLVSQLLRMQTFTNLVQELGFSWFCEYFFHGSLVLKLCATTCCLAATLSNHPVYLA